MEESFEKCGLEAYRLLNIAYDPMNIDAEQQLVERMLAIATWSPKGIVQIESMMPEARLIMQAIEPKTKAKIEPGMKKVFLSMMFGKLDIETKKFCQKEGGR